MPRNSIEGSRFPTLEQEGRSTAHTHRASCRKKNENAGAKPGENERKREGIDGKEK